MGSQYTIPYFCDDCVCKFTVYTKRGFGTRKIYCPLCGDNVSVKMNPVADRNPNRKGTARRWNAKDTDKLIAMVGTNKTNLEIGMALGRTEQAIDTKVTRLRKDGRLPPERRTKPAGYKIKPWDEQTDAEVKRLYHQSLSMGEIAHMLDRTQRSVKARVIKLRKRGLLG